MADVRQNQNIKDDFNRAPESPLVGPTATEWAEGSGFGIGAPMAIRGTGTPSNAPWATVTAGQTVSLSWWTPETYDGDDAEVWAYAQGGGVLSGLSFDLGLLKNIGSGTTDGYWFRSMYLTGTDKLRLYRVDNSNFSAALLDEADGQIEGRFALLRRNGSDVEVWQTDDQGGMPGVDTSAWTMILSATDTNYTTGLSLTIGIADNTSNGEGAWDYFGGGPAPDWVPQFIRRPWRYKGRHLTPNPE